MAGLGIRGKVNFWEAQHDLTAAIEDQQKLDLAVEEILEDELDIQ